MQIRLRNRRLRYRRLRKGRTESLPECREDHSCRTLCAAQAVAESREAGRALLHCAEPAWRNVPVRCQAGCQRNRVVPAPSSRQNGKFRRLDSNQDKQDSKSCGLPITLRRTAVSTEVADRVAPPRYRVRVTVVSGATCPCPAAA